VTRLRVSPDLTLPDDAVTHTFAIFGKRGSGKSNTGVVLAEEMHRAGAPFVVLDPISAWWGLKSSFDGSGPGLPVYVFGGPHGDLPLQASAGQLMAQVFIAHRIPMVLDMKGWSGRERAGFVTAFAGYLLGHNDRVPAHVFLEEADAFVPQRPFKGEEEMLGTMDRLVRWGRQEGLGSSLITQRSAKVNKDVTTQADTLIAHRTIGPQDRDAIDDWIKFHAGGEQRAQVLASLATLPDGTAWVWSPEWLEILKQVEFRRRETYDSAATPRLGEKRPPPKRLAEVDVDRLREQLADTVEQAKANDPAELRKRIRELEKSLKDLQARPAARPETVEKIVEVPVLNGEVEHLQAVAITLQHVGEAIVSTGAAIVAAIDRVATPRSAVDAIPAVRATSTGGAAAPGASASGTPPRPIAAPRPQAEQRRRPESDAGASDSGKAVKAGARRMLAALAQLHPTPLTRVQVGTLAEVQPGGTFSSYLSALRAAGLVDLLADGRLVLTDEGQTRVAGEIGSGAPTTAELVATWRRKMKAGAGRMLDVLVVIHPDGLTRAELAERAEVQPGGTFSSYLSSLRRNGLLDETGISLRAGDALFLGGRS
jgi:DNA-binding transcriptional ArsR family regulator